MGQINTKLGSLSSESVLRVQVIVCYEIFQLAIFIFTDINVLRPQVFSEFLKTLASISTRDLILDWLQCLLILIRPLLSTTSDYTSYNIGL